MSPDSASLDAFPAGRVRPYAWAVLLVLAGIQAWAGRFAISPDGIAYLDLSDAVVSGQWQELLNAYWSPLYPLAIGILRAALGATGYWEFPIPHLVNFLFFAASIRAFEYFVQGVALSAGEWEKGRMVAGKGPLIAAYAFFGTFSLVMTPLTLTTPDIAVSVVAYLVLGALIRLRLGHGRRAAIMLGLSLTAGALTKTFMIPWAVICLGVALAVLPKAVRWRTGIYAVGPWLVIAAAWTVALSVHLGRPTFGDTGRLTYAWFVNMKLAPSAGEMPPATRQVAVDSLLPGVAIMTDGKGTNPVWYDPARWYAAVDPEVDLPQQGRVLIYLTSMLSAALAPLLFVMCVAVAANSGGILRLASRIWHVALPALAGIAGYTVILVATRYVVAFVIAFAVMVLAAVEWPSRIGPWRLAVGLLIPTVLIWSAVDAPVVLAMQAAILVAVAVSFALRARSLAVRLTSAVAAGLATRILISPTVPGIASTGFLVAVLGLVSLGIAADRTGSGPDLARVLRRWGLSATAVVLLFAAVKKYAASIRPLWAVTGEPNATWATAGRLEAAGLEQGMPIAIVGSPFEAYWARALGARIVAVIPPARALEFWALPEEQREAIVRELRANGARALVVTIVPNELARAPDWQAIYPSGVRVLRD